MNKYFDVQTTYRLAEKPEFVLHISDKDLRGSSRHFIRFDWYPVYAPSHKQRHHGFWDLPLQLINHERTTLTLEQGELVIKDGLRPVRLKPVWRANIPFRGYCKLHVSLWDRSRTPPEQKIIKSSSHVILPDDGELPLEQVYLLVTQFCNIDCVMCRRRGRGDMYGGDISPEVLQKILNVCPDIHSVHVQGIGEPLLNENIYEIIEALKEQMPVLNTVGTCTNATLLNRENVHSLFDTGIDYLYFSVDGATKETADTIRPGWYRKAVPAHTFVLFPVVLKNNPIALIYADKPKAGDIKQPEQELNLLRVLRNQAILAIKSQS